MKSRIAHMQTLKIVTVTAFASIFLVNCNANNYDNSTNNNAANQKASLLAQQALNAAGAAGLADSSWICNNDLTSQISGQSCNKQEQLYISKDLSIVSKEMEKDQPESSAANAPEVQCAYSQDLTKLRLASNPSAVDFLGSVNVGRHEQIESAGNAQLPACQSAYVNEEKQEENQENLDNQRKHHKRDGHTPAASANLANVEFSLSDSNGTNNELKVVITKKNMKTQLMEVITNIYTREPSLSLVVVNPPLDNIISDPSMPAVVLASPSPSAAPAHN
jgi:hypothetical protein